VTNQVSASGGGSPTATASDPTNINPPSGDFNGDGHPDLIWQDPLSGWAQVWYLGGSQGVTFTAAANLTAQNAWRIVGLGDFNGDGNPDVVWQDPATGAAQIWLMGGPGGNVFQSAVTLSIGNSFRIMSVADFNKDGIPDVIWQDQTSGWAQIWFMGGPQGTALTAAVNLTLQNTWRIAGTGDFNGDGVPDVVWQDPVTGGVQIWYLGGPQGNVVQSAVNLVSSSASKVAAIADFNGDGHPDVVWQDRVTGAAQVWFLTGAQGITTSGTATMTTGNAWRIMGPH
jgi:histidinol dehydrogenase